MDGLGALADEPAIPFEILADIKLIRVDAKAGLRAGPGDTGKTILEAFNPGTAPPDNTAAGVLGDEGQIPQQAPPDTGSFMRPGTGGLY